MHQFILEEHVDIIAKESGGEIDEVMHLKWDDFIGIMLRMCDMPLVCDMPTLAT
jgi:hypothetical protein